MYKSICKLENNPRWRLFSWKCSFSKFEYVLKPNTINIFPSYAKDGVSPWCYIGSCYMAVRMLPARIQSSEQLLWQNGLDIPASGRVSGGGGGSLLTREGIMTVDSQDNHQAGRCSLSGFISFWERSSSKVFQYKSSVARKSWEILKFCPFSVYFFNSIIYILIESQTVLLLLLPFTFCRIHFT